MSRIDSRGVIVPSVLLILAATSGRVREPSSATPYAASMAAPSAAVSGSAATEISRSSTSAKVRSIIGDLDPPPMAVTRVMRVPRSASMAASSRRLSSARPSKTAFAMSPTPWWSPRPTNAARASASQYGVSALVR